MRLKMNEEKTEFILCGSRSKLQQCITQILNVNGVHIPRNDCVKYVGGYIHSQLNFKNHISEKCKVAMLNIQRIKCIRSFLDLEVTPTS